jgi:glycerol-3-phosphate dehydrogenase (NAD(P)+)
MENQRIAVFGAGSWGTVLAAVLAENGYKVTLWARRQEVVDEINGQKTNSQYLPDIILPKGITATSSIPETVQEQPLILFVVPSHFMREIAR